jgi:hypothetical protein
MIDKPKPRWWQLIRIWQRWRKPTDRFTVTKVISSTEITVSTPIREVIFVKYGEAERLLLSDQGWGLAPEEDTNRMFGYVYLQRLV